MNLKKEPEGGLYFPAYIGHMTGGQAMDREKLLKQITITDFMATDLHLYLNTHPNDTEAMEMYNNVVAHSAQVRKEYEEHFGPLVSYRSPDVPGRKWSDLPWPWQKDFNFNWDEAAVAAGEGLL